MADSGCLTTLGRVAESFTAYLLPVSARYLAHTTPVHYIESLLSGTLSHYILLCFLDEFILQLLLFVLLEGFLLLLLFCGGESLIEAIGVVDSCWLLF